MEVPNSSSNNSTMSCEDDNRIPGDSDRRAKSKQNRARCGSTGEPSKSHSLKAKSGHSSPHKSASRGRSKESKAASKIVKRHRSNDASRSNSKSSAKEPRNKNYTKSRDSEEKPAKERSRSGSRYAASKDSLRKTKSSSKESSAPGSKKSSEGRYSGSNPVEDQRSSSATKDRKKKMSSISPKAESESKASRMRSQTSFRRDVNKRRSLVTPQSDLVRKQLFLLSDPNTSLPKLSTAPADNTQEQASCIPEEFLLEMERLERENQDLRQKLKDASITIERMYQLEASCDSLLEESFAVGGDSSSELNSNSRSISTCMDAIGSPANTVANPRHSQNAMSRTSLLKRSSSFAKRKASFWSREKASNAATLSSSFGSLIIGSNSDNNEQSRSGNHKKNASLSVSEHNVSSALEKQMRYRKSLSAGSSPKCLSSSF